MDTNKQRNLQDEYLNELRKGQTQISIYLVNGIRLSGTVESFDTYIILLKNGVMQIVFKHAISSIMPNIGPQLRSPVGHLQPRHYER